MFICLFVLFGCVLRYCLLWFGYAYVIDVCVVSASCVVIVYLFVGFSVLFDFGNGVV